MKLKVYGGLLQVRGGQQRHIVATTSWKRAAEIADVSISHLRGFWSITGNKDEIKAAMETPETLICRGKP